MDDRSAPQPLLPPPPPRERTGFSFPRPSVLGIAALVVAGSFWPLSVMDVGMNWLGGLVIGLTGGALGVWAIRRRDFVYGALAVVLAAYPVVAGLLMLLACLAFVVIHVIAPGS